MTCSRLTVAARCRARAVLAGLLALLAVLLVACGSAGPAGSSGPAAAAVSGSSPAGPGCRAPSPSTPGASLSKLPLQSLCTLPVEAARTWHLIETGGRLPYSRDGIVFNNAERRLPQESRGYYHEYTVPTPGSRDRGARRLITGEARELYYTGDHYASFVVVDSTAVAG